MTKVLLTGGSGFIAAHILDQLLAKGHHVVTTVRSEEKAEKIRQAYPDKTPEELSVVIVPDIAQPDAFDEVAKTPGLEVVLHTASPFHFNISDPKTDLVDPAVIGTTGILRAIARSAPSVRRVVVTSSFAAILDEAKLTDSNTIFTEASWNPVTINDIHRSNATAYRASKTLAEKAAWDFVADKANNVKFDLATVNPPLVFGPVVHYLASLDAINTSNRSLADVLQGKWKEAIPPGGAVQNWIDVRDVATAHVKAGLELPEAGGKRIFTAAGAYTNLEMAEIVASNFPDIADKLPSKETRSAASAQKRTNFDNSASKSLLGIEWIPFETTIVDTIKSLQEVAA
ncbi:NAD(P)-binding protein [Thozetella sp. PMI_491]|nr:NAD(P)-binding protein [Thozetella sp. PMI_491]